MASSKTSIGAAEYIRMSTDAQDLSPTIQTSAIRSYAAAHGLTLVSSYFDEGRSGLTLHKRPAMKKLLADVVNEDCPFRVILVYDISRWGRFQDIDASAYYEYHCRLHGVDVRYVQEPFSTGSTPLDALLKGMKRAMAAEYSRELAIKTMAGQTAALDRGFHMGSLPCIGVSRVAVEKHTGKERTLAPFEHKAMSREHVRWVRGSDDEVALVRRIFDLYTTTQISVSQLADQLHSEGFRARDGGALSRWRLGTLLASEVFIGNFVWGREKQGRRRQECDEGFRRILGAFEPVVSVEQWQVAKAKRAKRGGLSRTRERLLDELRAAVEANPQLTASDLRLHDCANRSTYVKWFGSFEAALAAIGRVPHKRTPEEYSHIAHARKLGWHFCNAIADVLASNGIECRRVSRERGGQSVLVNGGLRLRVQVIWRRERYGARQWSLRKVYREHFDYALVVRLLDDDSVFDSLLLSREDYFAHALWFGDPVPDEAVTLLNEPDVANRFRCL